MHNDQDANDNQNTDDYLDIGFPISGTLLLNFPTLGSLSLGFPTPDTHFLSFFALGAIPLNLFILCTILFSPFAASITSSGPLNCGFSSFLFCFLPHFYSSPLFFLSPFSFPCYFGFGGIFQQDLHAQFRHITLTSIFLIQVFKATLLLLKNDYMV